MTSLHVICGLPPPPQSKILATPVTCITRYVLSNNSMHHKKVSELLKKTKITKNFRQASDLQLSEITVTRQAIDNHYCYRHCYWKQQSLWLLTATSDIMKIQCFLWKVLRYFNLFFTYESNSKIRCKKVYKKPIACAGLVWQAVNQHIVAAFPNIYMFLKESDVDCCHIAFSKKKKIYEVQSWKMGEELGEGGKWINHGKVNKMLYFPNLFLDFWKLDEKCNILIFHVLSFFF